MGPFDPNAMTPEMSGMEISLGSYHDTMDNAWRVVEEIRSSITTMTDTKLTLGLAILKAAQVLADADEDMDAHSFTDDIKAVEKELERRQTLKK